MSERLNSVDIEDVLSSIRRLVSDDARVPPRAAQTPSPQAAAPAAAPPRADVVVDPVPEPVVEPVADLPEDPAPPVAETSETPDFASSRRAAAAVSEEAPRRKPVPVVDPQADKLILTPSLRIVPEPEKAQEPEAGQEAVPEAPMMQDATEESLAEIGDEAPAAAFLSYRSVGAGARLDAVMDQVAQGLDAGTQDWEPAGEAPRAFASDWGEEGGSEEAGAADAPSPIVSGDVAAPAAEADLAADVAAWETAGWATPDWQAVEAAAEVTPEILPGQDEAEAQPDESAADAITEELSPSMAEEPAMTEKEEQAAMPDWAQMEQDAVDEAVAAAALAAAAASAPRSPEAGSAPRWADDAEAQIRRELEEEVETSAFARFDDEDDLDNLDNRPFDEEMLRDLVRDIIREELQGALGERITRNVRKLVRAEIARAMAVRDFE